MDSLPPIGWERLATKEDMAALEERLDTRFDALRVEMGARFMEMRAESKFGRAKQTYVVLASGAAMLAGALTPIYLALFSGGAG